VIILIFSSTWITCENDNPVAIQLSNSPSMRHGRDITEREVWESDSTHIVTSVISIDHGFVKIKPGATIKFERDAAICIMDSGGLIADGSTGVITFTSDVTEKGSWKYIYFSDKAVDDSCRLINCEIKYGGGASDSGSIIFCDNAAPIIKGCVIGDSPTSGVTLYGDCQGIEFDDNTISNCDFVPLQTAAQNISYVVNNIYRENGLNQIRIIEGEVNFDNTWDNLSLPYRIADGLKIKNATLTIEPGIQLLFEYNEGATIADNGCLQAVGTPSERILFTGSDIGRWKGIVFTPTANYHNSQVVHCIIEKGGQDSNYPANIILQDAFPEISDCLIRQSVGYGVYISGKIKPINFNNNIITNNAFAPISISASAVPGLAPGLYLGNGMDVIEVRGGPLEDPITEDVFWDNLGLPYQVKGIVQIQASTLILSPGLTLQMAERSGFEVLIQGGLIADGTSAMIKIESVFPVSGTWNNIYFSNTADQKNCQLINCRISYGGGDINRPGMIYCDNISPTIRSCTIDYSLTWGIYLNGNVVIYDLNSNLFNGNGYGNYYETP